MHSRGAKIAKAEGGRIGEGANEASERVQRESEKKQKRSKGEKERGRLPPFYSGANLHNDQRLSCLSKLFSVICIIFCREREREAAAAREPRARYIYTIRCALYIKSALSLSLSLTHSLSSNLARARFTCSTCKTLTSRANKLRARVCYGGEASKGYEGGGEIEAAFLAGAVSLGATSASLMHGSI